MAARQKFYVVWKGRRTGVFSSWEEAARQVQGFAGAQYRSFSNRASAERAFQAKPGDYADKPFPSADWLFAPDPPIAGSIAVDAACSGSPGRLEYRGVDLQTGKQIFHKGPFESGTNNVGEFLAIVHALAFLEKQGKDHRQSPPHVGDRVRRSSALIPVYSDSETAIKWVQKKHCNTKLAPGKMNAPLFALIREAEGWLAGHPDLHPVLKWDTNAWGEIPADFNRK